MERLATQTTKERGGAPGEMGSLPITASLRLAQYLSLLIAILTGIASVAGLLYPDDVYPTAELRQSFATNDIVNLVIGLPILLGAMALARRGRLIGLLFWPGALFYGLYNYLVYLLAMPLNWMFLLHLLIVTASIYTTIGLVAAIDGQAVTRTLRGRVPERLAGGVLGLLGIFVWLRSGGVLANALLGESAVATTELALLVTDFIFAPAWLIGAVLLWRRQSLGYVSGAGLLFQASMLFVGLLAILIFQPLLEGTPFSLVDVVVVFLMGMVSFVPLALYARGVTRAAGQLA